MVRAYIGIGSNLGRREEAIERAVALLDEADGIRVVRVSSLIETEAVGGPAGQGSFLNGAAALECECSAGDLLDRMLQIELSLGRRRREKWGPRTIDLDLLLFGDEIIDTAELTVPHPRMHERLFVIGPLAEIAVEAVHPGVGMTIGQIGENLDSA